MTIYDFKICRCKQYKLVLDKSIKDIILSETNLSYTDNIILYSIFHHYKYTYYHNFIRKLIDLKIDQILNLEIPGYNSIIEYLEFVYSETESCIINTVLRFTKEYCKKYYTNKSALKN